MAMEFWMHGISSTDPEGCLERLRDLGFSTVVLGANKDNLAASKRLGLGTYVCTGTFSRSKDFRDESFLSVDVEGTPQEWFGSTCPNVEGVRQANLTLIENVMTETEADGLLLDGCRFASPASGLGAFFTCFCPRCQKKAKELGYNFSRMKKHARQVYRTLADGRLGGQVPELHPFSLLSAIAALPGIADWISFRRECVIEHFSNVSDLVHGMGAEMGGYIFTPCLSPLVGQDYPSLAGLLDIASPMIYRNLPEDPGPACLNKEAATLSSFLRRGGLEDGKAAEVVSNFLGLSEEGKTISEIDEGVSLKSIETELRRSSELLKGVSKLVPILYLGDEQVENSVKSAGLAGLDGVNFFVYKDEWRCAIERISRYSG